MKKVRLVALAFLAGGITTVFSFYVKLAIFILVGVSLWIAYDEWAYKEYTGGTNIE
ncbi:hypothetical protein ACYSNU_16690 [Enterococcus sp. LJL120]